jgi:hypothetical protein
MLHIMSIYMPLIMSMTFNWYKSQMLYYTCTKFQIVDIHPSGPQKSKRICFTSSHHHCYPKRPFRPFKRRLNATHRSFMSFNPFNPI